MTIIFSCVGQSLMRIDTEVVAANSQKFLIAHFDLDEVWKELAVKACFTIHKHTYHIPLDVNECTVPWQVIKAGEFRVSLIGTAEEGVIRATSTEVRVRVEDGPVLTAEDTREPTTDDVDRIHEVAAAANRKAQNVVDRADRGEFDGADGKSAYEIAVENGFEGTEEEWLDSLGGVDEDAVNTLIAKYLEENEITGEVDPEEIKKVVEDYLQENPPKGSVDTDKVNELIAEALKKYTPNIEEKDPTVPDWAKAKTKPPYTADEVGAEPEGAVSEHNNSTYAHKDLRQEVVSAKNSLSVHNVSEKAHNDIRLLVAEYMAVVEALLNSDDETLNETKEIVEYIKSNRTLIEAITTNKVNVTDIVNNLITNASNKPLSAAQGVVLKGLIEKTLTDANKYTDDSLIAFEEGYSEMYTQLLKGLYGDDLWQQFEQTGEFVSIVYLISESLKAHNTNEQAHSNIRALINDIATGKLDASKLTEAINTALAQAKESGEFDGATGRRGTGLLPVTTAPSAYTTAVNGLTPAYRILLSTVKTQASTTEVYAGDTIRQSYYHYPVIYVDASYVYCGTRVSIRGSAYTLNDNDKTTIVNAVIAALPTTEGVGF